MPFTKLFQSTPPVWGATGLKAYLRGVGGISIHAPRVGGDILTSASFCICFISIHAPRVGGDLDRRHQLCLHLIISIHAPRVGGD